MIQPTDSTLITEQLSRSDMQLIGQAVRKGWRIPDNLLAGLPAALVRIVAEGDPRYKIAAAKVLVAMQDSNDRASRQPASPPVVNVGVQVNGNPQPGRALASQIAQRIRTERLSQHAPD